MIKKDILLFLLSFYIFVFFLTIYFKKDSNSSSYQKSLVTRNNSQWDGENYYTHTNVVNKPQVDKVVTESSSDSLFDSISAIHTYTKGISIYLQN